MWPQGSPVSIRVAWGQFCIALDKAGKSRLKMLLRGNLEVFLELWQETMCSLGL